MPAQVTAAGRDIAACEASRAAVPGSLTGTVLETGAAAGANFGCLRPAVLGVYGPCPGGVAHV